MTTFEERQAQWQRLADWIAGVLADAYWRERYGPGYACDGMGV